MAADRLLGSWAWPADEDIVGVAGAVEEIAAVTLGVDNG